MLHLLHREHLQMEKNEREASEWFTKCIEEAIETKTVLINDMIHIVAHRK